VHLQEVIEILFAAHPAAQAENMRGPRVRIEFDEIAFAAPQKAFVGEEIMHLVALALQPAEFLHGHVDEGITRLVRIRG